MGSSAHTWLTTRSSGVLVHVSSLPGSYGIGNLGSDARNLIDFLALAGVKYWQICPIGPTGYGDSPYQTFSGRAGNPYFIDLDELRADGLLHANELKVLQALPTDHVDYAKLYELFWNILALAYDRFEESGRDQVDGLGSFKAFSKKESTWLEPFAVFMALKKSFGGASWTSWPEDFKSWNSSILENLPNAVVKDINRHAFYQYLFFGQWNRLRAYAATRGVGVIGDIPIFVSLDSADTWQNRSVFRLKKNGEPAVVAGVPPDYFADKGQLWGNPLYDWEYLEKTHYAWWVDRLRSAFELYDIIRLDHFRGFHTYWEIPAGSLDACTGRWLKGPGINFFEAIKKALPEAKIIAEDLGYIGAEVVALRSDAGLPGMKILQFGYGHDANNVNLPHYYSPESVVYTGTHDNMTTRGWLEDMAPDMAVLVNNYYETNGSQSAWPMIKAAMATVSRLAVVPMQDLMDLGKDCTFNVPGTSHGNWKWRYTKKQFTELSSQRLDILKCWIMRYDRLGRGPVKDYSEQPLH
jgi:4-alpha-glucanotransferase